ncbi:MAG: hypothetical protein L0Z62_28950 [Gemmataceae bacterium]|nr:hypothetical protein [Gemmataceae bacterium]
MHRACAGGALMAYVTAILGFPVPAALEKDHSQRYPCEHHACGCRSAADCWRHCCCLSPAQRWAWARDHQVEPPPDAEPVVVQGWNTPRLCEQSEGRTPLSVETSCCATGKAAACCSMTPQQAPKPQSRSGPRWQVGMRALQCQGLATLWINTGAVLPVPPGITWSPSAAVTHWLTSADVLPVTHLCKPPNPPPRWLGL